MLKLSQIALQNEDDMIIEILEPVIYTHVGNIEKTPAIQSEEKARVYYLVGKVVKLTNIPDILIDKDKREEVQTILEEHVKTKGKLEVGSFVIVTRNAIEPIQFPVEGFDRAVLANINRQTIWSIILDEEQEPMTDASA